MKQKILELFLESANHSLRFIRSRISTLALVLKKKKYQVDILVILAIFASCILSIVLGSKRNESPSANIYPAIPILWSFFYLYLKHKNYSYIAILSYIFFLLMLCADVLSFEDINSSIQLEYLILSFLIALLFVIFYQELFSKKLRIASLLSFIIILLVSILPLTYIGFFVTYQLAITRDVFFAISQTHLREALEFLVAQISPLWILVVFLFLLGIGFLLKKQEELSQNKNTKIERVLLFCLLILLHAIYHSNRENNKIFAFANHSFKEYAKEIKLFKEAQAMRNSNKIKFEASKNNTGETYIIVVGESLNKRHMSIYGYLRETNPRLKKVLDKDKTVIFENAYSSDTHTMTTLSYAFTQANQLNSKDFYKSFTIFDILNKSNFETYWITNQPLGDQSNLLSIIAHDAKHVIALNRTIEMQVNSEQHDEVVLGELKKVLANKSPRNRAIFIHLTGNHVHYCARYPQEGYNVFSKKLDYARFGELANKSKLHEQMKCYDTSVLYNDFVVASILKNLEEQTQVSVFVYFSDHGEDTFGGKAHGAVGFTYEMVQIPMIVWLSSGYKKRYPQIHKNLKKNQKELYSNDFLYDTLIGLSGVKTKEYQRTHDLTSPHYRLNESHSYIIHRTRFFTDEKNYHWWQKQNAKLLSKNKFFPKITPQNVHTLGKLNDIQNDGFVSFAAQANYFPKDKKEGEGLFKLTKQREKEEQGANLEFLLTHKKSYKWKNIYLEIKNLNNENYKLILDKLDILDKKYNIKNIITIASSKLFDFFQEFERDGWRISYILDDSEIIKTLKELEKKEKGKEQKQTEEIRKFLLQSKELSQKKGISSFSFHEKLYPFIRKKLMPNLPPRFSFHIWSNDSKLRLDHYHLRYTLTSKVYASDKRIKSILLPYNSMFE